MDDWNNQSSNDAFVKKTYTQIHGKVNALSRLKLSVIRRRFITFSTKYELFLLLRDTINNKWTTQSFKDRSLQFSAISRLSI